MNLSQKALTNSIVAGVIAFLPLIIGSILKAGNIYRPNSLQGFGVVHPDDVIGTNILYASWVTLLVGIGLVIYSSTLAVKALRSEADKKRAYLVLALNIVLIIIFLVSLLYTMS